MDIFDLAKYKALAGGGSGGDLKITDASYLFCRGARMDQVDEYMKLVDSTKFSYMFAGVDGFYNDTKEIPYIDTSKATDCSGMFAYCRYITSIPNLDFSNNENFSNMFRGCSSLVTAPEIIASKGANLVGMFRDCSKLQECTKVKVAGSIQEMFYYVSKLTTVEMDLNEVTGVYRTFQGCSSLTNLRLYNIRISIQIGSGTSYGHLLTVDSLVNTIKELCTVTSSQTLTMGAANLEKIAGLYCRIIDNTDEKKPMELCESTDEGAMTLSDYAMEKNWVIK